MLCSLDWPYPTILTTGLPQSLSGECRGRRRTRRQAAPCSFPSGGSPHRPPGRPRGAGGRGAERPAAAGGKNARRGAGRLPPSGRAARTGAVPAGKGQRRLKGAPFSGPVAPSGLPLHSPVSRRYPAPSGALCAVASFLHRSLLFPSTTPTLSGLLASPGEVGCFVVTSPHTLQCTTAY